MKKLLMSLAVTMLASMAAQAGITVNYIPGITYTTTAIYDYSTYTGDMNGMQVTAVWNTTNTETQTWASGVSFSGGFGLSLSGDSYYTDAWKLSFTTAALLNSLTLNGIPGNTVFDLTWSGEGTPNSASGKTFNSDDFDAYNVGVTYSNLLKLDSATDPVGDLYTNVTIDFGSGGITRGDYYFSMDTDNATTSIVPTPEPSSLILFGTGLAGLAIAFRRRHDR